jgi:hypothetical protein
MRTEGELRDQFEDRIHDAALQETGLWTRVQCAWRVRPLLARARKRIGAGASVPMPRQPSTAATCQ